MRSPNSMQRGFTLFELMITVAIIAVIAGIAIPMYSGYIATGRKTECNNEIAAIKLAESEYYLENNYYFPGPAPKTTSWTSATDTVGSNPIETASGGLYTSSYDTTKKIANANCLYQVKTTSTSGSTTTNDSYTITAKGTNQLQGMSPNLVYTK